MRVAKSMAPMRNRRNSSRRRPLSAARAISARLRRPSSVLGQAANNRRTAPSSGTCGSVLGSRIVMPAIGSTVRRPVRNIHRQNVRSTRKG